MNAQICSGCQLCIMACPYGAISLESIGLPSATSETMAQKSMRSVAVRCDLCKDWMKREGKSVPACVEACPVHALSVPGRGSGTLLFTGHLWYRARIMSESIGIIAGSGQFPRLVAEDAKAAGYGVVVCAFHGFTDPGLEALADAYTTVYLGQFDKVIDYFRKHGVRRLCMAGAINKPRALDLRPDFRAARILFSLRGKGDDALLRAIMADLEKEGFTLIQAAELSTSLLCPEGVLTRRGPSAEEIAEIDYGWPIAEALGRFDIGQCIVVKQGMVVAVECLEGTDAALRRGGELRGEGCVAIKRFKPKQDERVDLPSIGLQTVRLLIEQHYRCLAVDAGKTLFFDRAEALALADKHNFCIVALTEDSFGKLRLQAKAD